VSKDARVYLVQIRERAERIMDFTSEGRNAFLADRRTQDAVIRNLEVMGEAAKRVPADWRERLPAIPWKGLAGLRDVLIHQYEGVDLEAVWALVEKDLPRMRAALAAALPPIDTIRRDLDSA
jgi:uncharacterized protein with HEPN domain